jgi:tyrosinase
LADIPSLAVSVATGRRSVSKVPDKIPDTIPDIPEKLPAGGIAVLPGMSEEKLLKSKADWGEMYGDAETILTGDHRVALHGWEPFEVLADVTDGLPGGLNRSEIGV